MSNTPQHYKQVSLIKGQRYIVIDTYYLGIIKEQIEYLTIDNITEEIRTRILPYTETPFAEFTATDEIYNLKSFKRIDYNDKKRIPGRCFSIESGALAFVEKEILFDFINNFSYGKLVIDYDQTIDTGYWERLVSKFAFRSLALMLTTGDRSEIDSINMGTYEMGPG